MTEPSTAVPSSAGERLQALERLLARQSMLLDKLAREAQRSHSAVAALIALAQALIDAPPEPSALSLSFLDQMDAMGSALAPEEAERYRDDMQRLNLLILDAVNRNPPAQGNAGGGD